LNNPVFVSYAREDSDLALRLAADLKARGANVWLDQLDIRPGQQWDRAVERALMACDEMLVIISPAALESNNVMDEIAFALDEGKMVIPVLHGECRLPIRLRRLQHIDFRSNYDQGLQGLLITLTHQEQRPPEVATSTPISAVVRPIVVFNEQGDSASAHEDRRDRIERDKVSEEAHKQIEIAVYKIAKRFDGDWSSITIADLEAVINPPHRNYIVPTLTRMADANQILLGKWDRFGAFQMYPCELTPEEFFCKGSFQVQLRHQGDRKVKRSQKVK
jgi:hypothetical protein